MRSGKVRIGMVCALAALAATALASAREASPDGFQDIVPKQEQSLDRAAAWLARAQQRDGSWRANPSGGEGYPCAMTGLAGLALLSVGNTPGRGKYGAHVLRAISYLLKRQDGTGLITAPGEDRCMYGHGFAMTFLAECYGMDPASETGQRLRRVLEKAIALTSRAQSFQGGWYYSPNSGADEGSVTITQIQALRACQNAGVDVPPRTRERALDYIRKSQQPDGGIAYQVGQGGSRPSLSAAGLELLLMAGLYEARETKRVLEYVRRTLTAEKTRHEHDSYTSFYLAQAYHHLGGKDWARYFEERRGRYLREQSADGSWSYTGWGASPVFDTSVAMVVLSLPYEYLPVYQK
jgi:prenyltransferase beta subunit